MEKSWYKVMLIDYCRSLEVRQASRRKMSLEFQKFKVADYERLNRSVESIKFI